MTMELSGTAIIPDFYIGGENNDKIIHIREQDIQSAIANADTVPFVNLHKDDTIEGAKGIITDLDQIDGKMKFNTVINNVELESNIKQLSDEGKIPNVSAKMLPTGESNMTEHIGDDGSKYYTTDGWTIEHISAVKNGRCSDSDGCGIHDYSIINSKPIGEKMTDEMAELKKTLDGFMDTIGIVESEKKALALELSELKESKESLVAEMDSLKAESSDMKLVLSEFEEGKAKIVEKELQELKQGILVLDAEYEFSGEEVQKDLELVLSVLRKTDTRRSANVDDSKKEVEDSIEAMREFKLATNGL